MTREEQLRSEVFKNKSPAKKWTIPLWGKKFLWVRWQWADRDLWTILTDQAVTRHVFAVDLVTHDNDTALRFIVWRAQLAFAWL